jgi:predicted adenylyl cyclase CyaB
MPTNIEVKARARDFEGLKARAARLSDTPVQVIPQLDTFFFTERGRLKLRELGPESAQLIYYERADQEGPKRSDYHVYETRDAAQLKLLLGRALGVRGIVKKLRYLYLVGQTRLHLDDVEGLGQFMELEVVLRPDESDAHGEAIARRLISDLGVEKADLMESAYMDLLEQGSQSSD